MAYQRITRDIWEVQVKYDKHYGYETVCTELSLRDAVETLSSYQENEPQYPSRIIKKREKI